MLKSRKLRFVAPVATSALVLTTWSVATTATAGSARPTCAGHTATIVNRHDNATITGTSGDDVIVALGAGATVQAGGGDDIVCLTAEGEAHGGAGNDLLVAGSYSSALYGDDGDDVLRGGSGYDRLYGGAGNDKVYGGGGSLGDEFSADAGDDLWVEGVIKTNDTDDYPGGRFDFSAGATSGVHVDLSGPIVDHVGHGTADSPDFGHDRLRFRINDGHGPQVVGTPFADKLVGSRRSDDLEGNGGADVLWGLQGNDELGGMASEATLAPGIIFIWGGPGSDRIDSEGNTRQAVLHGGSGNDWVDFLQASTHVTGDDGDDVISGPVSPDRDVVMSGGAGTDSAALTLRPSGETWMYGTVTADLGAGTLTTTTGQSRPLTGFENLDVSTFATFRSVAALILRGTEVSNHLGVFDADDTPVSIYGLGGDDALIGGPGDDTLDGGAGNDRGNGMGGHNTCTSVETVTNCGG